MKKVLMTVLILMSSFGYAATADDPAGCSGVFRSQVEHYFSGTLMDLQRTVRALSKEPTGVEEWQKFDDEAEAVFDFMLKHPTMKKELVKQYMDILERAWDLSVAARLNDERNCKRLGINPEYRKHLERRLSTTNRLRNISGLRELEDFLDWKDNQ